MKSDYLVVGAGLFGAVFAREVAEAGKTSVVIDKRDHVAGNCHCENLEGILVHKYGPHLFHTNHKPIWDYVNRFAEFNNYQHKVKAIYDNSLYSLPFNMSTFYELWGCITPEDAIKEIERTKVYIENPRNLEEWAISQVGQEIYDKLIYGYTKKQWMREPKELPSHIIRRLPLRFTFNDRYHKSMYQGVPIKGYTHMVENMLDHPNITVKLNEEFDGTWQNASKKLVFSGPVDEFFKYKYGRLEYRNLKFENKVVDGDFQGIGQMNYTSLKVPHTRIIEHKHFVFQESDRSVITYETPIEWNPGDTPYLPVNDSKNEKIHQKYKEEIAKHNYIIGGRLGCFKYLDMHQVIGMALQCAKKNL